MATTKADNITQNLFNNPYGNKSVAVAKIASFTTLAAADTIDLMNMPAGAQIVSGFCVVATAITTATLAIGVRYADGTSTGGTTGTAVLSGTGVALTTALAPQLLNFVPFTNDKDTILYATAPNIASPGASIQFACSIEYEATGTP